MRLLPNTQLIHVGLDASGPVVNASLALVLLAEPLGGHANRVLRPDLAILLDQLDGSLMQNEGFLILMSAFRVFLLVIDTISSVTQGFSRDGLRCDRFGVETKVHRGDVGLVDRKHGLGLCAEIALLVQIYH